MRSLELKIPPPAVALLIAVAMWAIAPMSPSLGVPPSIRIAAALTIALAGGGFVVTGVTSFRRAKTTVNPMQPETASTLVRSGVYRISRNPMYVGLALVLLGWAVFLSSVWALLGLLGFVLYMNRFQIGPEERVLAAIFGGAYGAYKAEVRRWL